MRSDFSMGELEFNHVTTCCMLNFGTGLLHTARRIK